MKSRSSLALVVCLLLISSALDLFAADDPEGRFLPTGLGEAFSEPVDAARFAHPDRVFYPEIWIDCMCGNLSERGITADLEAIAEAGFNGVQLFFGNRGTAWPGVEQVEVLSPQWESFVRHAADEAHRLGLRFTLQNCAGWAMAGGPWIAPVDAMRHLVMSRTDVQGGDVDVALPVEVEYLADWCDYRDVRVLAFPTPKGDTGEALVSASAESNERNSERHKTCLDGRVVKLEDEVNEQNSERHKTCLDGRVVKLEDEVNGTSFPWHRCVEGQGGGVLPPTTADAPHAVLITLHEPTVVRTLVLSSVQSWNHPWCYAPGVHIKVEAVADGPLTEEAFGGSSSLTVFDDDMPQSCWQDEMNLSLALDEAPATTCWRVSITNSHDMALSALRLLSAARKNNWESECGRTLRALMPNSQPSQSNEAYIDKDKILDLTAALSSDGRLHTSLPEGAWTVLRLGHVNTGKKNAPAPPEATGFECNKYAVEGAQKHFAGYIGKLMDGPLAGGRLDGMLLDSWECEYQTWTKEMESEFRALHGYDLQSYLPALFGWVVDSDETTTRFLRDWRALINRLSVDRFYGEMARLGHVRGLTVTYETAAGDVFPADIMEYFKHADLPMCEFWSHPTDEFIGSLNFKPIKPTVSASRLYGKPRVAAEAFTAWTTTWDENLSALRDVANHNLIEGVTYLIYQAYTHNPRPDELVPGTSFGDGICTPFLRTQTWWRHMHAFNDCTARTSYLLERGRPVSDVLWYLGDEVDHKPDQYAPFPEGFKYDYCNPDILLHRLSVQDGRLVTPEGLSYGLLWLPRAGRLMPETLERLVQLVSEGAVLVGERPRCPATLADPEATQQRFDQAVSTLWGNDTSVCRAVGRGRVLSGISIDEALATLDLHPDVVAHDVQWLHRTTQGADWYFVCPPRGKTFQGTLRFHARGDVSLWDPVTGRVQHVTGTTASEEYTDVELSLAQAETRFVVFTHTSEVNEQNSERHKTCLDGRVVKLEDEVNDSTLLLQSAEVQHIDTLVVDGTWSVTFPGMDDTVTLDSLCSWTSMAVPDEVRAYAGTASYTTHLTAGGSTHLPRGPRYVLHLGRVEQVARVFVNGHEVQTLWTAPYHVDITPYLHYGPFRTNTLTIEVTNTWYNRLLWDVRRPESERHTWTSHWPLPTSDFRPSGLLGPVTLTRCDARP